MRKPLREMDTPDALEWIGDIRLRLQRKQQREQAYLARRSARGTHTLTDEAYLADQELENEILTLLDELEQGAKV
jgi:hypothetical protein